MEQQRLLYLDCHSGISGDMFVAALIDLGVPFEEIRNSIAKLPIDGVAVSTEKVRRSGFAALHFKVAHPPQHQHRHLEQITDIIQRGNLTDQVAQRAISIFQRLAQAEAKVHGRSIKEVHFHEVGAVDSIVDIVAAAAAIQWLHVDHVVCSEVPVGCGEVEIAHGSVSLPAPATAELLKQKPIRSTAVPFELTTPTGAALVAELVDQFGPLPSMNVESIGYGAASRDLPGQANILRAFFGTGKPVENESGIRVEDDPIVVMETNIDHVSGEVMGHCLEQLMDGGALDAFAQPIQMKKNRPATQITVLCRERDVKHLERVLFNETGTLGLRRWTAGRSVLERRQHAVLTPVGEVHGQLVHMPDGHWRFSPEFESCQRLSRSGGLSVLEIMRLAREAFSREPCKDK